MNEEVFAPLDPCNREITSESLLSETQARLSPGVCVRLHFVEKDGFECNEWGSYKGF